MLKPFSRLALASVSLITICVPIGGIMLTAEPSFAATAIAERPEEELLIIELLANNYLRNNGFIGYLPQGAELNHALIPITSLSKGLNFSIKAAPQNGTAEGWFNSEKSSFYLDLNTMTVTANGKDFIIPEGSAEAHFEDIYVRIDLLEQWLDVKIQLDISTLRLFISQETPFPFEEELSRQSQKGYAARNYGAPTVYNPNEMLPYQWITRPSFIWQNSLQANKSTDDNQVNANFSLQSKMDLLKFGNDFSISGVSSTENDFELTNARMTFSRNDPGNTLLGPLKAGNLSFGDVSYPDVPLIIGQKRGRGVSVSSESNINVTRAYGSERFDIEGEAPIGWDAELYRNGYFLGFQEISNDGRYNFEEVELIQGFNMFQIILYGPEGQKRTETKRVIRGHELLKENDLRYEFSVGQPDTDFIPTSNSRDNNDDFGGSGSIFYGVRNNITVGASVFTGSDIANEENDRLTAATATLSTAFFGLKTQAQIMTANEGRSGYGLSTTTQVMETNITASHKEYDGFDEDDQDLVSSSSINVNRNFGKIATNFSAEKNKFQRKEDEITLDNTIATNIRGIRMSNSLSKTLSNNQAQERFDGDFSIVANAHKWRLRGILNYDLHDRATKKLQNLELTASHKINKDSRIRLNSTYNFPSQIKTADLRYTREFENFSIDLNAGAASNGSQFVGVTFRTGLQPDHEGQYKMVSAKDSGLGSVGLRAFLDENGNEEYDKGEKLLKNIAFRSNRGVIDGLTDENGTLFVNGMPDGLTRFELDETSLPSIYIRPLKDAINIIPRGGATTRIDIGFEQLGEIDGFIMSQSNNGEEPKPVMGLEVLLINAETGEEISSITSEYDGYFVFSAIPLGAYKVQALPLWDENISPALDANLTLENSIVTDLNITLPAPELQISENTQEEPANLEPAAGKNEDTSEDIKITNILDEEASKIKTDGIDVASKEPLRGIFIHIGSETNFQAAQDEQKRLWQLYPDILKDINLYVYKILVNDTEYFRIVGKVPSPEIADELCKKLKEKQSVGGCSINQI